LITVSSDTSFSSINTSEIKIAQTQEHKVLMLAP